MKLVPTKEKADTRQADPFGALGELGPRGPGIGADLNSFSAGSKRKRPTAQALGDTPPRDGPFAAPSRPVAAQNPPRARARQRGQSRPKGGPNPFA